MAIGYTELNFANGGPPPLSAANMNHIDEGVKACADALDSDASTSAKGVVQLASTGVESATKVPKATGAELAAILTAGGFTLTAPSGANSLDGIADTATWKKTTAAVATALNAGTYDAASVLVAGIGGEVVNLGANYDLDTIATTCFANVYAPVNGPIGTSYSWYVFTTVGSTNYAYQDIWNLNGNIAGSSYHRTKTAGTWSAWYRDYSTEDDGNGGQPPSAKSNQVSNATIGWFAAVDCASGAAVTLPAGGTFEWFVTTYGATYNGVKSGISAGGAMTGTASANLTMYYKRLTA